MHSVNVFPLKRYWESLTRWKKFHERAINWRRFQMRTRTREKEWGVGGKLTCFSKAFLGPVLKRQKCILRVRLRASKVDFISTFNMLFYTEGQICSAFYSQPLGSRRFRVEFLSTLIITTLRHTNGCERQTNAPWLPKLQQFRSPNGILFINR